MPSKALTKSSSGCHCHNFVHKILLKGFQHTIYCVVTECLIYSSARIGSPVHRAFTEQNQHKRSFTPSVMADQMVNTVG